MFNYEQALKIMRTARKGQKKIGNNTYLIDRGTHFAVKLHNTEVVELYANGDVKLNSNGWETSTTKDRITTFSPFRIQQKKGLWSVWSGKQFLALFQDGMKLNFKGKRI